MGDEANLTLQAEPQSSEAAVKPQCTVVGIGASAGGLEALLATYTPLGKPVSLSPAVLASLEQKLRRPEGFASYEALRQ